MTTILEALIILRDKISSGSELKNCGICGNLHDIVGGYIPEFSDIAVNWKHFSGEPEYPISGCDAYTENYRKGTLWVGEQRRLRIDLIDFTISELQVEAQALAKALVVNQMMTTENTMKVCNAINAMKAHLRANISEVVESAHLTTSQKTEVVKWLNRSMEPYAATMRALYAYHSEVADTIDLCIELHQLMSCK